MLSSDGSEMRYVRVLRDGTAINAGRTKPKIRKVFNVEHARYEWRCSDTTAFCNAWADTQEAAYEGWLRQFAEWRRRQLA